MVEITLIILMSIVVGGVFSINDDEKKIKKSVDKSISMMYNILNKLRKRGKF